MLEKALDLAKQHCEVSEEDIELIMACRKNLLFYKDEAREKIDNFDVAQGALDSAEISELIGIYLLHRIKEEIGRINIGVYRDDILWVTEGFGPEIEKTRKKIVSIFKDCSLKLEYSFK